MCSYIFLFNNSFKMSMIRNNLTNIVLKCLKKLYVTINEDETYLKAQFQEPLKIMKLVKHSKMRINF